MIYWFGLIDGLCEEDFEEEEEEESESREYDDDDDDDDEKRFCPRGGWYSFL